MQLISCWCSKFSSYEIILISWNTVTPSGCFLPPQHLLKSAAPQHLTWTWVAQLGAWCIYRADVDVTGAEAQTALSSACPHSSCHVVGRGDGQASEGAGTRGFACAVSCFSRTMSIHPRGCGLRVLTYLLSSSHRHCPTGGWVPSTSLEKGRTDPNRRESVPFVIFLAAYLVHEIYLPLWLALSVPCQPFKCSAVECGSFIPHWITSGTCPSPENH